MKSCFTSPVVHDVSRPTSNGWQRAGFGKQGWARLPLFSSAATGERVVMEWWAPGTRREFCADVLSGVELFVVSGACCPVIPSSATPALTSGPCFQ